MNDEMEMLLKEEVKDELCELGKLQIGSDEYKSTVEGVTKLMDRVIEMKKIESNNHSKDVESELETKKIEIDKKDKMIRNTLTAAGIVIPAALTVWGTIKSLTFEKTGNVTTILGRSFVNKCMYKK